MYKQIIIARKNLNMSPGKLAAQVSHGSIAFLTSLIRKYSFPITVKDSDWEKCTETTFYDFEYIFDKDLYEQWIDGEFTKCVLQARNKNQLLKAKTMAEELGMKENEDFWLIYDSCKTELEPEFVDENGIGRTLTCIGFKPFEESYINQIGKKFHLYV